MSRPEHISSSAALFYSPREALKYNQSSRVRQVQAELAERCLELLNLPLAENQDPIAGPSKSQSLEEDADMDQDENGENEEDEDDQEEDESSTLSEPLPPKPRQKPSLILDIGCGSGLSGDILTEAGHHWIGVDISGGMLEVALENEVEGDLFLQDIGQGFSFLPGTLDGAISVSCIQWLCVSPSTSTSPSSRLSLFFSSLYSSLKRGARAVLQFYPDSEEQINFIMGFAMKAGFGGGLVIDYPNSTKRKKFFLVLWAGQAPSSPHNTLPQGLTDATSSETVPYIEKKMRVIGRGKAKKSSNKDRDWIIRKKETYRKKGKEGVPKDSKYTGRKRRVVF